MSHAKRKWASVWRPIATNAMSMEATTTDPMYTTELYKSVAVNETSVSGNEDSSEELKNAAPEVGILGGSWIRSGYRGIRGRLEPEVDPDRK